MERISTGRLLLCEKKYLKFEFEIHPCLGMILDCICSPPYSIMYIPLDLLNLNFGIDMQGNDHLVLVMCCNLCITVLAVWSCDGRSYEHG